MNWVYTGKGKQYWWIPSMLLSRIFKSLQKTILFKWASDRSLRHQKLREY